jgi:integrase
LHIGFRKGPRGGTWLIRENIDGKQYKRRLGLAEDESVDADHKTVLSFDDVLRIATADDRPTAGLVPRYTVNAALKAYWEHRRAKSSKASVENDKIKIAAHVVGKFGETDIADLTTEGLRGWFNAMVKETDDADLKRRSKATANRVRSIFFAALTHAYENKPGYNPDVWRRVKPFREVDQARQTSLTVAEAVKIINASTPNFRQLVRGSLYTGLRLGELFALRVADVAEDRIEVRHSKSGKPRTVPLDDEGAEFFEGLTAGKKGTDPVFVRSDGHPWLRNQACRGMQRACKNAGITQRVTFHDLRRTYASLLINRKTNVEVIQKLLGHADMRMTLRAYAHLLQSEVARAVEKNLPSFGLPRSKVKRIAR